MLYLRRVVALGLLGITLVLSLATNALAFEFADLRAQAVLNIGSRHVGTSYEFEEFNPGLAVGAFAPVFGGSAEVASEVGFYRNSLGRTSIYATGSIDTQVLGNDRTQLRLGAFAGLANYPDDARKFADSGVPTLGSVVLIGGAQATMRFDDRLDFRVRALPAGNVADVILTGQIAIRF